MDVVGLVGQPVEHSLSPAMFDAAFSATGRDGRYVTCSVVPDRLAVALDGAAALGVRGMNVTIPHKEAALALAAPTDRTAAIGSTNLIDLAPSPPVADNTDVVAMERVLDGLSLAPGRALLLGAGGAARAYAAALADAGWSLTVANRTRERAVALAEAHPGADAVALDVAPEVAPEATLVCNATSVGLETDETPLPGEALQGDQVVIDAVYRPVETRLLAAAHERGATTVPGTRLLLEQATASYARWFDDDVPRRAMADALRAAVATPSRWSSSVTPHDG